MAKKGNAERYGNKLTTYNKNRAKVLKMYDTCALCGKPVDKMLKYPDPYSGTVDHIIPVSKGGHPTSISNMQLAHFRCNRAKGDSLITETGESMRSQTGNNAANNRDLPWTIDWRKYRSE